MDNNPFKNLKKNQFPDQDAPKKKHIKPKKISVQDEELFSAPSDDDDLFSQAMTSVASLGGGQGRVKKRTHSNESVVRMDEAKGFEGVSKKSKKEAAKERSRKAIDSVKPKVEVPEADAFAAAMMGVNTLSSKGREVVLDATLDARTGTAAHDPIKALQELLDSEIKFTLEYTDEYVQGSVHGLDPMILGKLRAGQYSPEAHLDVHGMNAPEAHEALVRFLRASYNKGMRTVLLIPGRGKNSPEGYAVLRERIQEWLTRDPFKRVVLAFCTAQNKDGGAGALYVLLRKYKKSSNKIQWQRNDVTIDY